MKKLCQPVDGVCSQCGQPIGERVKRTCRRGLIINPIRPQPTRMIALEGLGDWTERMLKKIGVTEERWGEAKAIVGLDPGCDCQTRKAWLNKVSDWWRGQSKPQ